MTSNNPPFDITNEIIGQVAEIAELVGKISVNSQLTRNPVLRRKNRILTIHSSLAIEQNTLTLEQVTAILDGKHVLAPPKDIEEVRNAFEIYDHMDSLDPYSVNDLLKAHGVMMRGLMDDAGSFRNRPIAVVDSGTGKIIHFGTLPDYVPELVEQLMKWLSETDVHPLIKSCVFHYEFELIHPFSDGNGRIGRLWHTLLLSGWNPLFAWLPIESMIQKNQQEYYKVINYCNQVCASTEFIAFMLDLMKEALEEAAETACSTEQVQEQAKEQAGWAALLDYCRIPRTRAEMQEFCGISGRKKFNTDVLKPLLEAGQLAMTLPDKPSSPKQKYYCVEVEK